MEKPQPLLENSQATQGPVLRLAVVGDVHGEWSFDDTVAMHSLGVDMAMFVGDFGNEDVHTVAQIAALQMPKAVILGNHDAWYSLSGLRKRKIVRSPSKQSLAPVAGEQPQASHQQDHEQQDQHSSSGSHAADCHVTQQLELLGSCHVGFSTLSTPSNRDRGGGSSSSSSSIGDGSSTAGEGLKYTVLGARPFSKGGKSFDSVRAFYQRRYGVSSMEESAQRIVGAGLGAPPEQPVMVLAHCGPAGLGKRHYDICGVDWRPKASDHGDPDLQAALEQLQAAGRRIPLVLCGHMHHSLKTGGLRRMVHVDTKSRTVCLNAATVPRVRRNSSATGGTPHLRRHHFLLVTLVGGEVESAQDVWVEVQPPPSAEHGSPTAAAGAAASSGGHGHGGHEHGHAGGKNGYDSEGFEAAGWRTRVVEAVPVLRTVHGANGVVKFHYDHYNKVWVPNVWSQQGQGLQGEGGEGNANAGAYTATAAAVATAAALPPTSKNSTSSSSCCIS